MKKINGGQYATILKGSTRQGVMIDGQTPSEIKQFGLLPGNDWASSLGQNPGLTAQMQADAPGQGQAGGKRNKNKTNKKSKKNKHKNKRNKTKKRW